MAKREVAKKDPRDIQLGNATLTATGIVFEGTLNFDEWRGVGEFLERAESGVQWWIGDWLLHGEGHQWGDRYEQAISMFNRDYDTLRQYKAVSEAHQFGERSPNLTWSHHLAVAYAPPETRQQLLAAAEPESPDKPPRMSVSELRKAVRAALPPPPTPPLPKSKFNLIYADPPWRYEHCEADNRKIENHYPTMALEDICNLNVQQVSADDCVLFLWATSPKLSEAIEVIQAWGFTYRTCMVWVKDKIGMGYYARQKHELLLICARGEPSVPAEPNRPASVVEAPRGDHSCKPDVFYTLIESMYPTAKKVELFCRSPRPGWASWGNEIKDATT